MLLQVTLDRTSLDLDPLVITNEPGSLRLTESDITWPTFAMRRTYVPDSDDLAGAQLKSKVADQGTFAVGISAHGDTTAEVEAAKTELETATCQFSYTLTLEVDGVEVGTYWAHPEFPNWGALDSGDVAAHICKGTITIPINPPGSP